MKMDRVLLPVDKGLPIPTNKTGGMGGKRKYPFEEMDYGDSFFAPVPYRTIHSAIWSRHNRPNNPKRYTARKTTENGIKGVRVWRIGDRTTA